MLADFRSVCGLLRAKARPAQKLETDAHGFERWSSALGDFWTPPGVHPNFISMLVGEVSSNTYDLTKLPDSGAGAVVIDAGANVGVFTLWALRHGARHVYCFEPSPLNAACLKRNLAGYGPDRVTIVQKGLWNQTSTLRFETSNTGNPGGHHVAPNDGRGVEIEATSLDEFCEAEKLARLDFIKMDIEGSERNALAGAVRTLEKFRPQLCVVTEHTDDLLLNTLSVHDFMMRSRVRYRCLVTEAHVYESPLRGMVLTPYSILFIPAA